MGPDLRIEPIAEAEYETLLPLIADYQRFYGVDAPDEAGNRAFFRRFLEPSEDGLLLGAWEGGEPRGYACLYWFFTSISAAESVLLNDLYVVPEARGQGVGRALIQASAAVARERGAHHLEWSTAPDNATSQHLYDSTGAERSAWLTYELGL